MLNVLNVNSKDTRAMAIDFGLVSETATKIVPWKKVFLTLIWVGSLGGRFEVGGGGLKLRRLKLFKIKVRNLKFGT